jgi:CubicO group peptidase (beta-lactamase class C family)
MVRKSEEAEMTKQRTGWMITAMSVTLVVFAGCASCCWNVDPVDFTPMSEPGWEVSTPEAEGFDRATLEAIYHDASRLNSIYGLLVVKNGRLVAEAYFNEGTIDQLSSTMSVTKSVVSAAVGIAVERGEIASVNQRMVEFFPDVADDLTDPRKAEITVRQLLQMRAGYPWELAVPGYFDRMFDGVHDWLPLMEEFELVAAPGTDFSYSNYTSSILSMIVARAAATDLRTYTQEHLFDPLGVEQGDWWTDANGYAMGNMGCHLTARGMARFGQLYLDEGMHDGVQVLPAEWVRDSFATYSTDVATHHIGPNWNKIGYGYQWWWLRSGSHLFNAATGHGGQLIAVVPDLDMVVVLTAAPQLLENGGRAWREEKAHFNLVGNLIASIPGEE